MEAGAARFYRGWVGRAISARHRLKVLAAEIFLSLPAATRLALRGPCGCQMHGPWEKMVQKARIGHG